jgi:hypothetical protein
MGDLIAPFHLVFLLILLAAIATAAAFAMSDARRRGKSPMTILLLVVAFFPLGLAVWLAFRPEPLTKQISG